MAKKTRSKPKAKKRVKGKVKLTQRARLVEKRSNIIEKNDATRVASKHPEIPTMQAQMPRTTGAVFRVKIKRK